MGLNPDAVGARTDQVEVSWTRDDSLLYSVAIGAGPNELAFTTENSSGIDQQVAPTFPVVIGWGRCNAMPMAGTFDFARMVHGRQSITLHRPVPPEGEAVLVGEVVGVHDKGSAAVVDLATHATQNGEPLYTLTSSQFIQGGGGFGGTRGSPTIDRSPPARQPDHQAEFHTSENQALIYRLLGDRNPLHSDPAAAEVAGFDRPILHGLCTFGFAGRALLHELCDGDPTRFLKMSGRFSAPVYPGDTLTIRAWVVEDGRAVFTTSTGEGGLETVIDQGSVTYR